MTEVVEEVAEGVDVAATIHHAIATPVDPPIGDHHIQQHSQGEETLTLTFQRVEEEMQIVTTVADQDQDPCPARGPPLHPDDDVRDLEVGHQIILAPDQEPGRVVGQAPIYQPVARQTTMQKKTARRIQASEHVEHPHDLRREVEVEVEVVAHLVESGGNGLHPLQCHARARDHDQEIVAKIGSRRETEGNTDRDRTRPTSEVEVMVEPTSFATGPNGMSVD